MSEINYNTTELDNSSEKKVKIVALIGTSSLRHVVSKVRNMLPQIEFLDFTHDGANSSFALYICTKYFDKLKECDLYITCFDIEAHNASVKNKSFNDLEHFFKILAYFKKQIVFINISDATTSKYLYYYVNKYCINLINLLSKRSGLTPNLLKDKIHLFDIIVARMIKKIYLQHTTFKYPINIDKTYIDNFTIITPDEIEAKNDSYIDKKNHIDQYKVLSIQDSKSYYFPRQHQSYYIHSLFGWNLKLYTTLKISNINDEINTVFTFWPRYKSLSRLFKIDGNTTLEYTDNISENIDQVKPYDIKQDKRLGHFMLGDMLLVKNKEQYEIGNSNDFENIDIDKIKLNPELNISYLAPDLDYINEVVADYKKYIEPIVLAPYKKQIAEAKQDNLQNKALNLTMTKNQENTFNIDKQILKDLSTFRLDFKLENNHDELKIESKNNLNISYPQWFENASGQGCVVINNEDKNCFKFSFISPIESKINFSFRGIDKRKNDGSRLAFWTTYKNVIINGTSYGDFSAWHDKPKNIAIPCKKDEKIEISFSIDTYKYSMDELKELLKEIYGVEDEMTLKLVYAYVNTKF